MSTVVVVGTQWGDEGKGKITDYLAESADVVAVTKAATMPATILIDGKNSSLA